jgi:monothiol glutaredoxin
MTQANLSPALRARIDGLIASDDVVLFMKGDRNQPRCGFSATVVQILDGMKDDYVTVDVLADAEIREGIKVYSDWPTIPQLYVKGELIGGADITKEMAGNGELQKLLGVTAAPAASSAPIAIDVVITDAAAKALAGAREQEAPDHRFLRVSVSPKFQHKLSFGPALPGDASTTCAGIDVRVDKASIARAAGLRIDFINEAGRSGFKIENPNEPAAVKNLTVKELKARLDAAAAGGTPVQLFDVRTPAERAIAKIDGARLLDDAAKADLEALDKNVPVVFHCHHGGRSAAAAEHYLARGHKVVFNVVGGIDAWSQEVDSKVTRY